MFDLSGWYVGNGYDATYLMAKLVRFVKSIGAIIISEKVFTANNVYSEKAATFSRVILFFFKSESWFSKSINFLLLGPLFTINFFLKNFYFDRYIRYT